MASVLYLPDGNRRFARKSSCSLLNAYIEGGKTLKLFSEFFIAEGRMNLLIYHGLSVYTHNRTDLSLDAIYKAAIKTIENLIDERFFTKHNIAIRTIDHSGKLPPKLKEISKELTDSTRNANNGMVIVLLGYSLEKDVNQALSQNPRTYQKFKKHLIFSDIDLVIRPTEMRISGGPVYAMAQAQMITLCKLNPEVRKEDLEKIWAEYRRLKQYRESIGN